MTPVFPMNTNGNLGTESVIGQALGLSLPVSLSEDSETLVEVAGIEPAMAGDSTPATKRDSAYSREALIIPLLPAYSENTTEKSNN